MSKLHTPKKYKGKPFGIPFAVVERGTTSYKVKLSIDSGTANFDRSAVIDLAIDRFITHYFPEFYIALEDTATELAARNASMDPSLEWDRLTDVYTTLRERLGAKIEIETQYPTSPPTSKEIVVCKLRYDVFRARDKLSKRTFLASTSPAEAEKPQLPLFAVSLEYFNNLQGLGPTETQTEFPVKKLAPITQTLQEAFSKFGKQQNRSKGPQPPIAIEFGFLGISVSKILSAFTEDLTARVKGIKKSYKFREGDTITFYFGRSDLEDIAGKPLVIPQYGITGIKYLAADQSISSEDLKIGHFSMVKYSQALKDPVVAASLKNYDSLLQATKQKNSSGNIFSVEEFFGTALGVDTSEGFPSAWDVSGNPDTVQDDENNALINTAVELGIIDIADTSALQVSIGAYTSEQLMALNQAVTKNPELYEAVFEGQEKKREEVSPDVFGKIEQALLEGPMAAVDDNSPAGAFMRHFGIKALVKEALLCLTFGMNFEIARIVAIVDEIKGMAENGNIVVEFGGSVRGVTKPQIPIPSFGDLSIVFPMFQITGDIWKMILDIIIETLQDALLQIIAQLAELLRELCDFNNPRSRDYGDTNMRDLIPRPRKPDMGSPSDGPWDPLQGTNLQEDTGMNPDDILEYLSDLSSILSSLDICILLTNPSGASEELLQKILDYNLNYEKHSQISSSLNTFTAIIGFFAQLSKVVDVTDLCNEIANEVGTINQDNICLTEDDIKSVNMDDADNIEALLDILKNGLQPEVFRPNFECPDNPNYIEDPTFRKSIYETLNALVEIVELQFSYSTESIKEVMMDSRLQAPEGAAANAIATVMADPNTALEADEKWPPPPDESVIGVLKKIMEGFEDVQAYEDQITACINDNQELLDLDINLDIGLIPDIMDKVIEGMEIAFAAGGKMGNLIDALEDAENAAQQSAPGTPLVARKVFNQRFLREFRDYVQLSPGSDGRPATEFIAQMNPQMGNNYSSAPDKFFVPAGSSERNATSNIEGEYDDSSSKEVVRWNFRTTVARPGLDYSSALTKARYSAAAVKKFGTSEDGVIQFVYPPYGSGQAGTYNYNLKALFEQSSGASAAFATELESVKSENITLDPVVDSVRNTLLGSDPPGSAAMPSVTPAEWFTNYATKRVLPLANGLLTDYLFDYYISNGIFDAATLQSLNFFHNNENCAPGNTADLLDVDGIINEMLRMFEKLACHSDLPARKKVRVALKYGMYLLFAQIHIAEFVIKNIFVFAAANVDELFSKDFILLYMRDQIENSISQYLDTIDESLQKAFISDLVIVFQLINNMEGGLTDFQGNVIFSSGEKIPETRASYNKIINYLIGQRVINSRSSVNNAIKQSHPNANPLPLEEIFLRSIPAYATYNDEWINPDKMQFFVKDANSTVVRAVTEDFGEVGQHGSRPNPRFFLVKEYHRKDELDPPDAALAYQDVDNDTVEIIVRYQFWLSYEDSEVHPPAAAMNTGRLHVYPLLPASRKNYAAATGLQSGHYEASDKTFDRALTLTTDDPLLDSDMYNQDGDPVYWRSASLTADDVSFLLGSQEYQAYFTNVFNSSILSMVPLIQNFYLTTKYFDEIGSAMKSTKDVCLNIITEAIASDDHYDKTPNMSRPTVSTVTNTLPGDSPFDAMMRDFIIMMLIKTPIRILKSILELIDPHVAISKVIKNITGQIFNIMSQVFDEILETAEPLQELGIDSGEKLLAIVLCFMDVLMKNPPGTDLTGPAALKKEIEAFFPRITPEGVDFLGSIMGLIMLPPTPLGILYLLLSLINVEVPSFGADTGDRSLVDGSSTETEPTEC